MNENDNSEISIIEQLTHQNREATKHDFSSMELSPDTENAQSVLDPELINDAQKAHLSEFFEAHLSRRFQGLFKKMSASQIMSWQSGLIHSPLTKLSSSLEDVAVQLFKNLQSYCGERASSKKPMLHAIKHLRLTIFSPEELKDEAYCQVLKQITNNPSTERCLKAWNFLALMASSYPPSSDLYYPLINYLLEIMKGADTNLIQRANYISVRLMKTFECKRKLPPCEEEIRHIEEMKPIMIQVYFFSGASTNMPIESYTTIRELKTSVMKKLQLNISRIPYYGLYEICDKPKWIEERYLDEGDRITDILAVWAKEKANHEKDGIQIDFKMFLKIQLFYSYNPEDIDNVTMSFVQTNFDVINGKFKLDPKTIVELGAVSLYVNHGTKSHEEVYQIVKSEIKDYIPNNVLKLSEADSWANKIMDEYTTLQFNTTLQAKNKYLDILKNNDMWQATQFYCKFSKKLNTELTNSLGQKNPDHITDECIVAVKPHEVLIMDKERNELLRLPFNQIASWGVNADIFVIVSKKSEKEYCKYYFECNQSKLFKITIDSYTGLLSGKNMVEIMTQCNETCKMFESLPAAKLNPGETLRSRQATVYMKPE